MEMPTKYNNLYGTQSSSSNQVKIFTLLEPYCFTKWLHLRHLIVKHLGTKDIGSVTRLQRAIYSFLKARTMEALPAYSGQFT